MYLSPPDLTGNELRYIQEAIASNWIAPAGPQLDAMASLLKELTGSSHILPVNSGTSAIHLALIALGITEGDVVFCPTFTFAASIFPILYQKAQPVFIDSEAETWNMDPTLLEQAIQDALKKNQRIKAIVLVHIYGFPAQVSKIKHIAQHYGLSIIEDAAESLGSTYDNQHTGTFGSVGVLSFNGNKIVTGGSGGAVLTNDKLLFDEMLLLSNQAKEEQLYYEHKHIGYNYRMCNVNAAIARGQLEQLSLKIIKKKQIRAWYQVHLEGVAVVKHSSIGIDNAWLTCVQFDAGTYPQNVQNFLEQNNIECRRLWNPMHLQPVFKGMPFYSNGISNTLFETGLCLPSGTQMNQDDVIGIANLIKKVSFTK
jgi:pyridoxal phosphate-dependent aminotransferase EpsN